MSNRISFNELVRIFKNDYVYQGLDSAMLNALTLTNELPKILGFTDTSQVWIDFDRKIAEQRIEPPFCIVFESCSENTQNGVESKRVTVFENSQIHELIVFLLSLHGARVYQRGTDHLIKFTAESYKNFKLLKNFFSYEIKNVIDIIKEKGVFCPLKLIEIVSSMNAEPPLENEIEAANERIADLETHLAEALQHRESTEQEPKTAKANAALQEKTANDWAESLEKAVAFAVERARGGKKRSRTQDLESWRKIWGIDEGEPRKQALEAFRRGLPDDLKGN